MENLTLNTISVLVLVLILSAVLIWKRLKKVQPKLTKVELIKGYIRATFSNGHIKYYTVISEIGRLKELGHYMKWAKSAILENGCVKVTDKNGFESYYSIPKV